ncbi:IPT/TIG domain-containing protein [Lysobacter sp. CCNWLW3]|uniref:beta strand repeat-containing protein n=1 Tax=unclassified Lysobacter TaxID=2635362 RepID=UPI002FD15492
MAAIALCAAFTGSWAFAAKYVYDGSGRLVVVTNDAGQSARYVYDKIGNLLRIERLTADQVAVFAFAPARGGVGLPITIQGQGFSATPALNTVSFNGAAATVTSASATELVALVPIGATTGPLTVTVGAQTATGPADFVVDENALPPSINSVSPLVASVGTAITVNGERLHPMPDRTRVLLNGRLAMPGAIANQQLSFPVPVGTGSGRVTVLTPYGRALSDDIVLVSPNGINPADIVASGRLLVDGPAQALSASAANQQVGLLIDGETGLMSSLQFAGLSGTVAYTLYGPNNAVVLSGSVGATTPSVHLPRLNAATYLLLMKPSAVPASWNVALEKNKLLRTVDGPLSVPTTTAYQSKRLIFTAAAGQNLGLGISDYVVGGTASAYSTAYVYRPDGSQLAYETCYQSNNGCEIDLANLAGGTYSITLTAPASGNATMGFKATLSPEITTTLQPDTSYALDLARRGQDGRLTFAGSIGQTLALRIAGQTTLPANQPVYYTVRKPDGSVLQGAAITGNGTFNLANLPVAGNYTVFVDPYYGATATAQLSLLSGVTGAPPLGGEPSAHATAAAGQNAYLSFSASAGQNLGLGISDLVVNGTTSGYSSIYVYRQDGSQLTSETCYQSNGGCELDLLNLAAGNYSVTLTAPASGNGTMSFKATLSAEATATLPLDGAYALELPRRGQNGRYSFAGNAGQTLALRIAGQVTVPATRDVYYTISKPDGTLLQGAAINANGTFNLARLPVSGTYSVFVDPYYGATATAQLNLLTGVTSAATTGGDAVSLATVAAGQNAYLSFTASAGQNLGMGISDLVVNGTTSGYSSIYVYRPDGSQLLSETCYQSNGGCELDLNNLGAGTYSVTLTAPTSGNGSMSFKATLSPEATALLQPDAAYEMSLARRGQNGRYSFAANAGQTLALRIASQVTVPAARDVYYTINKPDGSLLQGAAVNAAGTFNFANLPATGIYTVFVDPYYGATAAAQLTLLSGVTGAPPVGGDASAFATAAAGQQAYFTFSASAGQNLGLGISDYVVAGTTSGYSTVYVYRPDGSQLQTETCYQSNGGCELDLTNLTAGQYSATVSAPSSGNGTMSFKATLSPEATASLQADVAYALDLPRRGQNARLSFAANAGQTVALRIAGQTTTPASRDLYYTVSKPDGSLLQGAAVNANGSFNLANLPVTGTYSIFVDPYYGATATAQLTLASGSTGTTPVDGDPSAFATTAAGQHAYLSFNASAGQNLGLGISDYVVGGTASGYSTVYIYRPDGSQLLSDTCYQGNGGCEFDLINLAPGNYSVTVMSPNGGNGLMSFKATLSAEATATLQPDVAYALDLPRRGQNGRLSFAASAGQTLALRIAGQVTTPASRDVYYTVSKPDGSLLQGSAVNANGTYNFANLPVSGTYSVFIDPYYGATASAQLTLAGGITGSGTVGGATDAYVTAIAGQHAYFSFTASEGQNLGLGISDYVVNGTTSGYSTVYVYRQDGSQLTYETCYQSNGGCELDLPRLGAGSYNVVVQAPAGGNGTMSFKTTLSPDVVATLTAGTAQALDLSRRGQNARLSFNATAGQTVSLQVASQATVPAGRQVYYTVSKPDGTVLQSSAVGASGTLNLANLAASGTYAVFVDPYYGASASALVTQQGGSGDPTPPGPSDPIQDVDSAATTYATQTAGQKIAFDFNASTGQNLGLGIGQLTVTGGSYATIYVYRPDGSQLTVDTCYASNGGCDLNFSNLPGGRYRVQLVPNAGTMSLQAAVSSDLTATLQPDTAYGLNLAQYGRNARLSFAGSAGQSVALRMAGTVTTPVNRDVAYIVYKPDGTSLASGNVRDAATLNLNLPTTGNYRLWLDPLNGEKASGQVTMLTGVTGVPVVGGDPSAHATVAAGQNATLSFSASAGQNLGLGISDYVVNGTTSGYSTVYVYRPDGSQLTYETCYQSYGGCELDLNNLAAGTYTAVVQAPTGGNGSMSFKALLSAEATTTLQPGTAYALDLSRRGQNARLSFAGSAGQTLALRISGQTTVPAARDVYYTISKPDGSLLQGAAVNANGIFNLHNLPASGNYTVFVDPYYGATASAQLTLVNGATGVQALDGSSSNYATQVVGQQASFTFNAGSGQNVGIGIDQLSFVGGTSATVYAYRPDGSQATYETCYASNGGCDLNLSNLVGGTYKIVVVPDNGTMSFRATASTDLSATLQPDTAYAMSLTYPGRNARLSFAGSAGQTVALRIVGQTTVPANRDLYYSIYKPDGTLLQTVTVRTALTMNLTLPASGDYFVWVDPYYGETANASVTLVSGVTGLQQIDGAAASYATQTVAQQVVFGFDADAGQNVGLGLSQFVIAGGSNATVYVYRPDGSQLGYDTCYPTYGGCDLNLTNLSGGRHRVVVVPDAGTVGFQAALSTDLVATLQPDTAYALDLSRSGRNARLSFAGSAGQTLALRIADQTTVPASRDVLYAVYKPDGTLLQSANVRGAATLNLNLPASGDYFVWIDPTYGETALATVSLSPGTINLLETDGGSIAYATQTIGQNLAFDFVASSGQNLGLGLSGLSMSGATSASVYVYRPDGSTLLSESCSVSTGGCDLNLANLTGGKHRVVVAPAQATIAFQATLSSDLTGTLQPNTAYALDLARYGRNARLTFAGNAGQPLSLKVTGQTTSPASRDVYYQVYKPDGTVLQSNWIRDTLTVNLNLPAGGDYLVWIDPGNGETTTAQLTLVVAP